MDARKNRYSDQFMLRAQSRLGRPGHGLDRPSRDWALSANGEERIIPRNKICFTEYGVQIGKMRFVIRFLI